MNAAPVAVAGLVGLILWWLLGGEAEAKTPTKPNGGNGGGGGGTPGPGPGPVEDTPPGGGRTTQECQSAADAAIASWNIGVLQNAAEQLARDGCPGSTIATIDRAIQTIYDECAQLHAGGVDALRANQINAALDIAAELDRRGCREAADDLAARAGVRQQCLEAFAAGMAIVAERNALPWTEYTAHGAILRGQAVAMLQVIAGFGSPCADLGAQLSQAIAASDRN
jgi:hypothetical protein